MDDLSSAQIKRLKNYLQTILSSVTSPTKQQREKITPLKTDILKLEKIIPVQKTRDVQLTEESPETNTQEVAIDKLLRKFTAESMKQGKWGDRNLIHCNAFPWSGRYKRWQGEYEAKISLRKITDIGRFPLYHTTNLRTNLHTNLCRYSQSIVGVRQVNLIASQEPSPPKFSISVFDHIFMWLNERSFDNAPSLSTLRVSCKLQVHVRHSFSSIMCDTNKTSYETLIFTLHHTLLTEVNITCGICSESGTGGLCVY